jgi:hypothetical protein
MKSELMTTYEAYGFNAYRRFPETNGILSKTNAKLTQTHLPDERLDPSADRCQLPRRSHFCHQRQARGA